MSISAVYYRKADGVIFVFDVTKPKTFTDIETIWMQAVEAPEQLSSLRFYLDLLIFIFCLQWLSRCSEGPRGEQM